VSTPWLAITTAVLGEPTSLINNCWNSLENNCTSRSRQGDEWLVRHNTPEDNLGVTGSLQWLYEHTTAPVIAFLHSDLEIFESGWDERVLREFDDPAVGVVGFGGAKGHGEDDIYKTPYNLTQLRRIDYLSNTTDAEQHGTRFTGSCEVAVLDGFALVVRRELLRLSNGWPVKEIPFHCYDYWAAITAHKLGYSVRCIGIACQHWGGATSTTPAAQEHWQQSLGKTDQQLHEESHRWIYEYGRNVLPWRAR